MKTNKRMKKWVKITLFIISLFLILAIFIVLSFTYLLKPVSNSSKTINFSVEKGSSKKTIVKNLKSENLIRSEFATLAYLYINNKTILMDGTYKLSQNMSTRDIIYYLSSGKNEENKGISITFVEGKRLTSYATKISEAFAYNYDDIIAKWSDETYLKTLISKYTFLSNEILDKEIYYPLEGYLYPDTYTFNKSDSIESITEAMLDNFENHYKKYKNNTSYTTHQIITLASIVELEGNDDSSRKEIAGVFYNRLNSNMSLGSDVTTYYGAQKKLSDTLTVAEFNEVNAYNTRVTSKLGLPVGPICNVSDSSINAVLNPSKNDYYYFYADTNKKVYFTKTYEEHLKLISSLKNKEK